MPKYIRDILPTEELNRISQRPGRYPTVARLGSKNRRGDNAVFFDDTQTVLYKTSSYVSFPTTFPVSSSYISDDLKSSLSIRVGNVTKAGTDQFVVLRQQIEQITPFKENRLHEQNFLTDNFQSGSDVVDVGFGFSSRLRDKTVIRLELPVKTTTRLVSSGGYYYNFQTQTFDAVPTPSTSTPASTAFQILGGLSGTNIPPLFTCLGTQLNRNFQELLSAQALSTNKGTALNYDASKSLLQSDLYIPSGAIPGTQFITKNKKIVIEKAVFEIPFAANSGWLNDSTQQYITWDLSGDSPIPAIGGPAITVALLNQTTGTRDVIMTGTIVPANDMTQWTGYQFAGFLFGSNQSARCLGGFSTWSTPACVIAGTSTFTGSAFLKMDATVANGLLALRNDPLRTDLVAAANSFGRAMKGLSGRSVFGHDYAQPQLTQVTYDSRYDSTFSVPGNQLQYRLANLDKSAKSPYLFTENDNLAIYINTPQPALSASGQFKYEGAVTASHNVSVRSGTMYLTLYGSEIANSTEFHDTLNQRLETNEIHEMVGTDPILDQFEVPYRGEYRKKISVNKAVQYINYNVDILFTSSQYVLGTFVDERDYVYENFSADGDNNSWSTQFGWSRNKRIFEIRQSTKNISLVSDETFADCILPNPFAAMMSCNKNFFATNVTNVGFLQTYGAFVNPAPVIYAGVTSSFLHAAVNYPGVVGTTNPSANVGVADWFMSYPYEPRYKDLSRVFATDIKREFWPTSPIKFETFSYDRVSVEVGPPRGARVLFCDFDENLSPGIGKTEFIKLFYGFGDGISSDSNQYVVPRFRTGSFNFGSSLAQCADIRGWRHGLYSAFPINTKAVFRRSSYGQLRDMLEQRQDSKFFRNSALTDPVVTVKFRDSSGNTTLPEYTFSSNLSSAMTSSIPYTDGKVRNREEPLEFAKLNQSIAII